MKVIVASSPDELAISAADLVQRFLGSAPSPALGLATGASVQPLHRELVRRHRDEGLSFAAARAFLLDEYVGLAPDHPQLYRNVVRSELADTSTWTRPGCTRPTSTPATSRRSAPATTAW